MESKTPTSFSQKDILQLYWNTQPRAVRLFNTSLEILWDNTPDRLHRYPIYQDNEGCPAEIPLAGTARNAWPVARALATRTRCTRHYWIGANAQEEPRCYRVLAYPAGGGEDELVIVEETERVDRALCHDERLRHLDAQLCNITAYVADLMMNREEIDPLKLRLANPNLQPCQQIKNCRRAKCPAYDVPNLRCWEISSTLCPKAEEPMDVLSKFHYCNRCAVYLLACPDPLTRVGENFNRLLSFLQLKYEESLEVQNQIQHSERLAAIGELTLGIVHEIKNPLSVIISRLDCLSLELDAQNADGLAEDLGVLRAHTSRMRQFLDHLLAFSTPAAAPRQKLQLNELILNTLPMVHKTLEKNRIRLKSRLTPNLPEIMGDAVGIQQVLLNLFLNARDALAGGGQIEISTAPDPEHPDGVRLAVRDNGCGIPAEQQKMIFSPFFTTKAGQGGTGLGLAICTRIMERHEGRITVRSSPGKGATFTLIFKGGGNGTA